MISHIADYYTDDIVIQRSAKTSNGVGGFTTAWSTHLSIKGKMQMLTGQERLSADKETMFATHRLYCAVCDITEMDRVLFDGEIYEIKSMPNDMMGFGNHFEIDLEYVR